MLWLSVVGISVGILAVALALSLAVIASWEWVSHRRERRQAQREQDLQLPPISPGAAGASAIPASFLRSRASRQFRTGCIYGPLRLVALPIVAVAVLIPIYRAEAWHWPGLVLATIAGLLFIPANVHAGISRAMTRIYVVTGCVLAQATDQTYGLLMFSKIEFPALDVEISSCHQVGRDGSLQEGSPWVGNVLLYHPSHGGVVERLAVGEEVVLLCRPDRRILDVIAPRPLDEADDPIDP